MSALSDLVAQLESGGGVYASKQPASMVNPVYGQYAPFVAQYGSGPAGVDNYARQVLAANPNATLGDVYSGYVLGTGNPASTPGLGALQAQYPAAYNNLVNNAGYPLSTPVAQLLGTGAVTNGSSTSTGIGGDTLTIDSSLPSSPQIPSPGGDLSGGFLSPGTDQPLGGSAGGISSAIYPQSTASFDPSAATTSVYCAIAPWACGAPGMAPGFSGLPGSGGFGGATPGSAGGGLAAIASTALDFLTRFGLIILGAVLVAVAAWAMARGELGSPRR